MKRLLLLLPLLFAGCASTHSQVEAYDSVRTNLLYRTTIDRYEFLMNLRASNLDYIVGSNGCPSVKVTGLTSEVSPEGAKMIEAIAAGAVRGAAEAAKLGLVPGKAAAP